MASFRPVRDNRVLVQIRLVQPSQRRDYRRNTSKSLGRPERDIAVRGRGLTSRVGLGIRVGESAGDRE